MAIKLIVDSASDIMQEEAKKMNIEVIPMMITFDDKDYLDGIDILPEHFYIKLKETSSLPKTSMINQYRYEEIFNEATKDGDSVICITISSKLSGTYQAASQVAQKFNGQVHIVDSLNACIGERLLCEYAKSLIDEGLSIEEIVSKLNEEKSKINVMAVIDTLEYLKKGGRISSLTAFAGALLNIKPLIAIKEGEVKIIGKAMGGRKANLLLKKLVLEQGQIDFSKPYGVVWSGLNKSNLERFMLDGIEIFDKEIKEVPAYILGATIGTHIGPGACGIAFFEK